MKRDLAELRDFEITKNKDAFDIIYKKEKLRNIFETDPDVLEILGRKSPRPLNPYKDAEHPTDAELKLRADIVSYNRLIQKQQIVPYLKLNDLQNEVLNFIMFDIQDNGVSYTSELVKKQYIVVMCLVHEDDMDTEYGIPRCDLLSYLVKDLLCWTNSLGPRLKCESDVPDIVDSKYYCRTLKFIVDAANASLKPGNKYDRFTI